MLTAWLGLPAGLLCYLPCLPACPYAPPANLYGLLCLPMTPRPPCLATTPATPPTWPATWLCAPARSTSLTRWVGWGKEEGEQQARWAAHAAVVGCSQSCHVVGNVGWLGGGRAWMAGLGSRPSQSSGHGGSTALLAGLGPHPDQCPSLPLLPLPQVLVPSGSLDSIPATSGGLDPPSTPTVTAASGPSPAEPQASPALAPAASPVPAPVVEQPVPAQVPATPAPAPASEAPSQGTLTGVALASGYLVGCNVQLVDSAGASQVRPPVGVDGQPFGGVARAPCAPQCTRVRVFCPACVMPSAIRLVKFSSSSHQTMAPLHPLQIMVTDTTGRFVFNCLGNCVALGVSCCCLLLLPAMLWLVGWLPREHVLQLGQLPASACALTMLCSSLCPLCRA
jgi:hypothetical protein